MKNNLYLLHGKVLVANPTVLIQDGRFVSAWIEKEKFDIDGFHTVVLQGTGIDLNGRELIEGDLLRSPSGFSGEVVINASGSVIQTNFKDFHLTDPLDVDDVMEIGYEVFGNRHLPQSKS